uniref:Uncharacterized protein n=1 Tax=Caenorhabditis japonica TaxID=281687 RepID=A0A8R1J0A4_CAEJA
MPTKKQTTLLRKQSGSSAEILSLLENEVLTTALKTIVREAVKEAMTLVNGRCSAMQEHIAALESELGAQRARLEKLERKMKETPETTKLATTDFERKERERSMVAINIPEGGSRFAHDNSKMDIEKVSLILKHLDMGYQPTAVYRMGKTRDDGRPRPMKIILPCQQARRKSCDGPIAYDLSQQDNAHLCICVRR